MKIDGQNPTSGTGATSGAGRTGATGAEKRASKTSPGAGGRTDRVEVSPEAQLLAEALKKAEAAPAVRSDRVDEVKQKLQAGQIGSDADKLADTLIDDLLDK